MSKTFLDSPIIPNGNFTWREALTGSEGVRYPPTLSVLEEIYKLALAIQPYREKSGVPWRVTSWYRTPEANARAGGAENSLHLRGAAIDFYPVRDRERVIEILKDWSGGFGIYPTHLHLDTGRRARW